MDLADAVDRLAPIAAAQPRLRLPLVLGSRAAGTAHHRSDWDLGYLADDEVDHLGLLAEIARALGTNDVDLVDLDRASALLRFEAGRDGAVVHERDAGSHIAFVVEATRFWCDIEPVARRAHEAALAELPRCVPTAR